MQALREFRDARQKATTDDERKKAIASEPDANEYVARMMELVESAPDDPAAVDALIWVVDFGGQTKEVNQAIERLARDHVRSPKIGQVSDRLARYMSPAAERLLRHRPEEPRSLRSGPGVVGPRPVAEERGPARPPIEAE